MTHHRVVPPQRADTFIPVSFRVHPPLIEKPVGSAADRAVCGMENEITESLHALYGILTFRERLKLIFGERLNIQGRDEVFIPGNPRAIYNVLLAEATHNKCSAENAQTHINHFPSCE